MDLGTLLRKRRHHVAEPTGELNIVPYLDIVTNLVMFLLQASAIAVNLGEMGAKAPTVSDATPPGPPVDTAMVMIAIDTSGYFVLLQDQGGSAEKSLARLDGRLDEKALLEWLTAAKKAKPALDRVTITPGDSVTFDDVVLTADVARGTYARPMFTEVAFAGF